MSSLDYEMKNISRKIDQLGKSVSALTKNNSKALEYGQKNIEIQKGQSLLLDTQVEYLTRTVEALNRSLIIDLKIKKIDATSDMVTSTGLMSLAQNRVDTAVSQFINEYKRIVKDFVNGIISNIKHFVKLNQENITPLFEILDNMKIVFEMLNAFTAERTDIEIINFALNQFDSRLEHFSHQCNETKSVLQDFVSRREEVENKLKQFFIETEMLNLHEKEKGFISLLTVPLLFSKISSMSSSKYLVEGPLVTDIQMFGENNFLPLCKNLTDDISKNARTLEVINEKVEDQKNLIDSDHSQQILAEISELLTQKNFYPKHLKKLPVLFTNKSASLSNFSGRLVPNSEEE